MTTACRSHVVTGASHVDYEVVFRAVLDRPDLGYVVVGNGTLVVYGS